MNGYNRMSFVDEFKEIPVEEVCRYISKCGKIPTSMRKVGIESLYDLYVTKIDRQFVPKGFPFKKAIEIQSKFKELSLDIYSDIIFWNSKREFPSNYNSQESLETNLGYVLDELYGYICECKRRLNQIRTNQNRDKIIKLERAIKECYYDNKPMSDIARSLNLDSTERVRQVIKDELLSPLFDGTSIERGNEVLGNIAIKSDVIDKVNEYANSEIYSVVTTLPSRFCQHVLNVDCINVMHNLGYIIVPAREKGVYDALILSFYEEMTQILKPMSLDGIIERISENKKVRRDILGKGKVYDNNFIYALLYCEDLTNISDDGIILRHKHIRHYTTGGVMKERALARILADAEKPLTKSDIKNEYIERYGEDYGNVNLTTTEKFGCTTLAGGRNYWVYGNDKQPVTKWIEEYSQRKEVFYFDEICKSVSEEGYIISPSTLRTYVTNVCVVDNGDKDHFCYKKITQKYNGYNWRNSMRYGVLNWIANELRQLFAIENVDQLHISKINKFLFERSKNTDYEVVNIYDHATVIQNSTLTSDSNSPFIIESRERGDWFLKKNPKSYDYIEWGSFGLKGRMYEQKLIALATNIVRQTPYLKIDLIDLVDSIIENEGVENLSRSQIRKKLLMYINTSKISHSLKLGSASGRNRLFVYIDSTKVVPITQLKQYDWDELKPLLYREFSFCSCWLESDQLLQYDIAIESFASLIMNSQNKNLNYILPHRLYEFFFVSGLTYEDKYCIMCSIAKNFEAFLSEIYYLNTNQRVKKEGLFDLVSQCGFETFKNILDRNVNISSLRNGGYEQTLKYLSRVRNSDAHGDWYVDSWTGDGLSQEEKTEDKIKRFVALYIFAVAKYLN